MQTEAGKMFSTSIQRNRIVTVLALATMFHIQSTFSENRMQLKRESDRSITVELANDDAIAGFQFSLQGHGGITWGTYEGSDRARAAGLAVYQYLRDDSTLNVVLLAPYRSALPFGRGIVGRITFSVPMGTASDPLSASLAGVVICNADAQVLDVSVINLTWLRQEQKASEFTLEQNYPNPFNPSTTIAYTLAKPASVRLAIYDIAGRLIHLLVNEFQEEGHHAIPWNAGENRSTSLASGMYLARLEVDGRVAIKKMIFTK